MHRRSITGTQHLISKTFFFLNLEISIIGYINW